MATSYNKVILVGNLTKDPELRYTPNGTAVATFGLATNRRYKQGEEWKEETCFIDIVVFGRQAESASEYLSKGRAALIDGRLKLNKWESEDGQTRSKHEVIANTVQFLPSGRGPGEGGNSTPDGGADGSAAGGSETPF